MSIHWTKYSLNKMLFRTGLFHGGRTQMQFSDVDFCFWWLEGTGLCGEIPKRRSRFFSLRASLACTVQAASWWNFSHRKYMLTKRISRYLKVKIAQVLVKEWYYISWIKSWVPRNSKYFKVLAGTCHIIQTIRDIDMLRQMIVSTIHHICRRHCLWSKQNHAEQFCPTWQCCLSCGSKCLHMTINFTPHDKIACPVE